MSDLEQNPAGAGTLCVLYHCPAGAVVTVLWMGPPPRAAQALKDYRDYESENGYSSGPVYAKLVPMCVNLPVDGPDGPIQLAADKRANDEAIPVADAMALASIAGALQ